MDEIKNHPLYGKHTIDTAMNAMWDFYKSNFLALFLISLVMSLVIQYISTYVNLQELQTITDPMIMMEKLNEYLVPIGVVVIVNLLFSVILQYFVIYNPIDKSNNIGVSILRSMKYFFPFLVIMVILGVAAVIAAIIGILALVVGIFFTMLYILTIYLFILPILMVEGPNIGHTLNRTIKLAHTNFWSNIGWTAVCIILVIVISLVLSGIVLLPFTGSFIKSVFNPDEAGNMTDITKRPLFLALSAVVNAITLPLIPVFSCILYFNGRAHEEQKIIPVTEDENRLRVEDLYAKPWAEDHPDNPENRKKDPDNPVNLPL